MSAFHPKATEQRTQFYVGFVPDSDNTPYNLGPATASSFYHLVGEGQQR
jgi:hypothetical protein